MEKTYIAGMFLMFCGVMLITSAAGTSDVTAGLTAFFFTMGMSMMLKNR